MKSQTPVLNQLKLVLQVPPKDRTHSLLNMLLAFTKDIEFFRKLTKENSVQSHWACCAYMKHEQFQPNQQIFAAGDEGNKFYIIIQGSVSVLIPLSKNSKEFEEVSVLYEGQSFGELALIRNDVRIASIVCREETHTAVLEKQDFKRIIGEITEKRINEAVSFLQSLPLFNTMTRTTLLKLSYYFKQRQFTRKQVVYHEGDETDFLYFVKEGEFQLLKKVAVSTKSSINRSPKSTKSEVAILGKGEFFGDEEVMQNKVRMCTCICYSTAGEVFYISKQDFMLRINEDFYRYLKERNSLKSNLRDNKVDIQIPDLPEPKTPLTKAVSYKASPKRPKIHIEIEIPKKVNLSPSNKSPYKISQRTLPELMLSRLQQKKKPKTKQKRTRFVNIHVEAMRSLDQYTHNALEPTLSLDSLSVSGDKKFPSVRSPRSLYQTKSNLFRISTHPAL